LAEYRNVVARMICQVPSVTMKGGSFITATSQPLAAPRISLAKEAAEIANS
jgi:hypothetical protein